MAIVDPYEKQQTLVDPFDAPPIKAEAADLVDPFAPVAEKKPSATILQKTQSAIGKGLKGAGELISGFGAEIDRLVDPFEYKGVDPKTGLPILADRTEAINQKRDAIRGFVDKFADEFMHASDKDREPENLVERLTYGFVEFLPMSPVYHALGGPAGSMVKVGLANIAERFGPVIAKQVAAKLPEMLVKAGKYAGGVASHGLEEGVVGASAELMAGKDLDEAIKQGGYFAAYAMAFKALLKDPARAVKKAAWDSKEQPITGAVPRGTLTPYEAKGEKTPTPAPAKPWPADMMSREEIAEDVRKHMYTPKREGGDPIQDLADIQRREPDLLNTMAREGRFDNDPARLKAGEVPRGTETKEARKARVKEVEDYLRGAGYDVVGVQEHPRRGELFWFTDPKTGSTLLLPLEKATPEGIEAHVAESRAKFFPDQLHSFGSAVESLMKKSYREMTPDEHIKVNEILGQKNPVETFYDYAFSRLESSSPAAGKALTYSRKMGQHLRDFLDLNGIPALTRLGVGDTAFEHGGAHLAAPRIVDDMIARTMGADYGDWRKKSLFMSLLVKDRIHAGYKYNVKVYEEALAEQRRLAGEAQTVQEDIWLFEEGKQGKTLKPEQETHLQGLYDKRNDLQRQAKEHESKAQDQASIIQKIEQKHNIRQYEWDIQDAIRKDYMDWIKPSRLEEGQESVRLTGIREKINAWNHPEEGVTQYLDKLWRESKGMEAGEELAETGTYGTFTKTRISLVTKNEKSMSVATGKRAKQEADTPSLDEWLGKKIDTALDAEARAGARGGTADVAKDPKDHRATFAGDYSLSMEKNLNNTIRPRLENATKERLYRELEAKGVVRFDQITARDILPDGVQWLKWKERVKRPMSAADPEVGGYQRTALVDRDMWVRSDAKTELEGVLNVGVNMNPFWLTQLATRVQLFQVVDFVTHAKNLLSEEARALGKGKGADLATRVPVVAQADAVKRIAGVFGEVRSDSPEIRAELRQLADLGVLRPTHGQDAILPTGKWLWEIDTATRVLMNRQFDQLAKEGKVTNSVTARRNFINQVGQYNDRFMQPWMRFMRRVGLSPFIVAGRTFNRNATRALTGNPGVEGATPEATAEMHRTQLATVAMSAAIPMIINTWTTGNPMGRPGTPLFGVDLGREQKDDGTHDVIDLGQVSGLARATREWGIADTYAGLRSGQTPEQIAEKAGKSVARGRGHPWIGPPGSFGLDWHKEGFGKAVEKINPTIVNPLGANKFGFFEKKWSPESGERTLASRAGTALDTVLTSPAGAFGYKDVRAPRSAAEQYITENRTKTGDPTPEKMRHRKIREHAEALLKKNEDEGHAYLQSQIDLGEDKGIGVDYANQIVREQKMSKLQRGFNSMSVDKKDKDGQETAIAAYKKASIHEKAQLYRMLENKIANKEGHLSAEKMERLATFLDAAYGELVQALADRKITMDEIYERE